MRACEGVKGHKAQTTQAAATWPAGKGEKEHLSLLSIST